MSPAASPFVFVSASHKDEAWSQRLRAKLQAHSELAFWDDSLLEAGSRWEADIGAAIDRATVAVVLLSPDYLSSDTATNELARLGERAHSGRLTLFPILLFPCPWNQFKVLREVQVWSAARPIGELDAETADRELEKAADAIAAAGTNAGVRPGLPFSSAAMETLKRARSLADQSNRAGVTSSCILFALADRAGTVADTAQWLREQLNSTGRYEEAFNKFLKDSGNRTRQSASDGGELLGKVSRNVSNVLERSQEIARRVSPDVKEVHQRHLFAALLTTPDTNTDVPQVARNRLKQLGIDLAVLQGEFRKFIQSQVPRDIKAEWDAILIPAPARQPVSEPPPPVDEPPNSDAMTLDNPVLAQPTPTEPAVSSAFVAGTAGYSSEFCGVGGSRPVPDHLGVDAMAHRLAELIALRETRLPLAVGLFGNWGSGKSHFMNLMDRRLKALMAEDKKRPAGAPSKWCGEIVPIYFNAWHYIDTNLWASLVSQIFESLFDHLSPKKGNELEEVQKLLEQASGATARAAEELNVAHSATERAKSDVILAESSRRHQETVVNGFLQGLKSLLPEVTPEQLQQQVVELLDVHKEVQTIAELRSVVEETRSLGGRLRAFWNAAWKSPGRAWRLAWLAPVVLISAVPPSFVARLLPQAEQWLHGVGRIGASAVAFLPSLLVWIGPSVATVRRGVRQLEDWEKRAKDAQQHAADTPELKQAKSNQITATLREEAAKIRLTEAEGREQQLRENAKSLSPERRLGRFIEQRAQSSDYRGQLGLVSLARRDFQELSDLFADDDALNERVKTLQATSDPEKQNDAAQLEKLSKSIDRIVLFVDDLDRCQPERVVDVLQAVHLLLAFPLFAVVVGVDQRCLRQSLRKQFKGLLTPESERGPAKINLSSLDDDERPATPLDYLEKIFHIPFHLPAMEEGGFGTLMQKLTEPSVPNDPSFLGTAKQDVAPAVTPIGATAEQHAIDMMNVPVTPAIAQPATPQPQAAVAPSVALPIATPPAVPFVGSVPLHDWERQALKDYHLLIRTPRGATRLLNTYRLVRAGVPEKEWDPFQGDQKKHGEFRIVMLLLASAAGYPAVARKWFETLRSVDPAALPPRDGHNGASPLGWTQFRQTYDATFDQGAAQPTKEQFLKWLCRVEQFTF